MSWPAYEHYKLGLEIRKTLDWLDSFKLEKPVKPTLQDDLILTRFGRTMNSRAREDARRAAGVRLRDEAERLMARAEAETPPATLVDVQVYEDAPRSPFTVWVKREFSDGSFAKALEGRAYANQLKYTFDAGKKVGAKLLDRP